MYIYICNIAVIYICMLYILDSSMFRKFSLRPHLPKIPVKGPGVELSSGRRSLDGGNIFGEYDFK